ncbi:MAG TPA: hypothetical protein VJS92_01230 [Candidatus Polarisedimenticolaceae bacterium]|nr:hypothetical protein [Candidatus Polarisedimenticolaceae bacterium]
MEAEPLATELSDQDRVLLLFGYLGPLALVSLLASRREFIKWHAKQGLALSASLLVIYPLLRLLHFVLARFLWRAFVELFWAGAFLLLVGIGLAALVCIVRGLEGERFKLPVLGDLADRL